MTQIPGFPDQKIDTNQMRDICKDKNNFKKLNPFKGLQHTYHLCIKTFRHSAI